MTYIVTYTGKKFSLTDPQPEDVCLEDLAHHLSQICRFAGACYQFYSVAQHCCILADAVPPGVARQALLHDAGEAYCGDIPSPLKAMLQDLTGYNFKSILSRIDLAIFRRFDVRWPCDPIVKEREKQLFSDEWHLLMPGREAYLELLPDRTRIHPILMEESKQRFLEKAIHLELQ